MIGSKRVLSFAAVLLATSFAGQAFGQSTQTTYTFASVTGIQYGTTNSITGVFANDTAATTITIPGDFRTPARIWFLP